MSYNLGTEEEPIIVFVELVGGMLDATIRCDSMAAFTSAAVYAELMYEVLDENGAGTGEFKAARGVDISHIGPVVVTPAVLDAGGVEITAAVMDTRHHVNFRLSEPAISSVDEFGVIKWHKWAMAWMLEGAADTARNKAEDGMKQFGVTLLDPATFSSRQRVFL